MEITIKIKDSDIKEVLTYILENEIYEQYSDEALKIAKVPTKAAMVKEIMADPNLAKVVNKIISRIDIMSHLYDDLGYHYDIPRLLELATAADKAQEAINKVAEAKRLAAIEMAKEASEEAMIKRTIKALEKAGYKITKA